MSERKELDEGYLRQMWESGLTCKAIGLSLGCSHALVSKRAIEIGLPRRKTDPTRLPIRKIIVAYQDHGMTIDAIRDELRSTFPLLSVTGIRNLLVAHHIKLRPRSYRMAPKGNTYAAECVQLARKGITYRKIGNKLGLTPRQVAIRVRRVLPPIPTGCWHRYDRKQVLDAYDRTKSYAKAASEVGCHWSAVRYHVERRIATSCGSAE